MTETFKDVFLALVLAAVAFAVASRITCCSSSQDNPALGAGGGNDTWIDEFNSAIVYQLNNLLMISRAHVADRGLTKDQVDDVSDFFGDRLVCSLMQITAQTCALHQKNGGDEKDAVKHFAEHAAEAFRESLATAARAHSAEN